MKRTLKVLYFLFSVWCLWAIPTIYATLTQIVQVNSTGTIKAIGIETDRPSIAWGQLTPTSSKTELVTVINVGTEPIHLLISTANWVPLEASAYLFLTSSYSDQTILPLNSLTLDFTLTVSADIIGINSFSFDIIIEAVDA